MIKGLINVGSKIVEVLMDRGDIKYLILSVLEEKPMHGYQIINEIKEKFNGLYSPSPGTIYPTLQMLEEQRLIRVERKGEKKFTV